MVLSSPVKQSTYTIIVNRIVSATKYAAKQSMQKAVEEEVMLTENPEKREISVSGDGSWKTQDHMSWYGIVGLSVIGAENGRLINVKVKCSYCKPCSQWKGPKNSRQYVECYQNHKSICTANHRGSAASMECIGLLDIFNRSQMNYNVKYIEHIGDCDTKSYKTVCDDMPYGLDIKI